MSVPPVVAKLARGGNFAVLTTLAPSGAPSTQVVWVDADDEHLLVNTEVHRAKYRNTRRDPRVALTIWMHDDPYRYVEVRGHVVGEVRGAEALAHIHALARRYTGEDFHRTVESERVILRIAPERVVTKNVEESVESTTHS